MTIQFMDKITHAGFQYCMPDFPLEHYWAIRGVDSPFPSLHTANWRGYEANWLIDEGKLFLTSVKFFSNELGQWIDALPKLFFDCKSPVWAHWYSGEVRFGLRPFTGIPPRRWNIHFELENRVIIKLGRVIHEDLFYEMAKKEVPSDRVE